MADQVKYVLDEEHIPKSGTTYRRTYLNRCRRYCIPAPASLSARPILSPFFRWTLSFRRFLKSATLRSPNRFETSIVAGALAHVPRPSTEKALDTPPRSFTSTKALARRAATSPIPPSHRLFQ